MENCIYFVEDAEKRGVIRFVKSYRKKSWFRKEKIEYTFTYDNRLTLDYIKDYELSRKICERIRNDYPKANPFFVPKDIPVQKLKEHSFWAIADYSKTSSDNRAMLSFFSEKVGKKVFWTEDLNDAEIYMDKESAENAANTIRQLVGTSAMVGVKLLYLNMINGLMTPIMMITCTSKRSDETKYFARMDEGSTRLRLVENSNAASKFTYQDAFSVFEYLRTHNKNFLYAVWPVFKDNVNYKRIEDYVRDKNVSRMVALTLKLK